MQQKKILSAISIHKVSYCIFLTESPRGPFAFSYFGLKLLDCPTGAWIINKLIDYLTKVEHHVKVFPTIFSGRIGLPKQCYILKEQVSYILIYSFTFCM